MMVPFLADQASSPSLDAVGSWIFCAASVLGCAYFVKQIFFDRKNPDPRSEYVTREELNQKIADFQRSQADLNKGLDALTAYTHDQVHKIADNIHAATMRVEASRAQLADRMNSEIKSISEKIEIKHDQMVQVLTSLFGPSKVAEIKK